MYKDNKKLSKEDIRNLKIGDYVTLRKNGVTHEFVGYCPIENILSFYNLYTSEIIYIDL